MIKPHGSDELNPLFVYDSTKREALLAEAETLRASAKKSRTPSTTPPRTPDIRSSMMFVANGSGSSPAGVSVPVFRSARNDRARRAATARPRIPGTFSVPPLM